MIEIKKYVSSQKNEWDQFCNTSKTPMFMFNRDFMDYHKDRFFDNSLMFYDGTELIAIMPANINRGILYSHGGLTYGGIIIGVKQKQHTIIDCIVSLKEYCIKNEITRVVYKCIPHIYHLQPSEEDIYALYYHGAKLKKIEATTVVNLQKTLKMSKGRKSQITRAKREMVEVLELYEKEYYDLFIALENDVLYTKHQTTAVHSSEELFRLFQNFPNHIKLIGAFKDNNLIAGAVLFIYDNVIHTQYMAANDLARKIGALDLVINTIIERYKSTHVWLDFGISTEENGRILNFGLIAQKEGFGGRTNIYSTWEMDFKDIQIEECV